MNEFKNYMSAVKKFFAGIAIKEGRNYSPIALQAWAGSYASKHTAIFKTPDLPSGICMFKVTNMLPIAWQMIEDILVQKPITIDKDIVLSFADFKFEKAVLTSVDMMMNTQGSLSNI